MASQINSAALLPLFWCHEEWVSLSVIKVFLSLYPLFHTIFCLYQKKAVTLHDFSKAASLLFTNN